MQSFQLDKIINVFNKKILTEADPVSQAEALQKAKLEYRGYQEKTLSKVEVDYLDSIKSLKVGAWENIS